MKSNRETNRWANTRAYKKAKGLVGAIVASPKKMLALLEKASQKSGKEAKGIVGKTLESLKIMIRLLSAYAKGEYRAIGMDNLALIVAAIVYFVMPLDALPDIIAVFGLADDAAVLAWTWKTVKTEIERFLEWELEQAALFEKASETKAPEADDAINGVIKSHIEFKE